MNFKLIENLKRKCGKIENILLIKRYLTNYLLRWTETEFENVKHEIVKHEITQHFEMYIYYENMKSRARFALYSIIKTARLPFYTEILKWIENSEGKPTWVAMVPSEMNELDRMTLIKTMHHYNYQSIF